MPPNGPPLKILDLPPELLGFQNAANLSRGVRAPSSQFFYSPNMTRNAIFGVGFAGKLGTGWPAGHPHAVSVCAQYAVHTHSDADPLPSQTEKHSATRRVLSLHSTYPHGAVYTVKKVK